MDRFQEMQVFLAVADAQGFAAAARRLKLSPPSVTRAVAALEARIGTQLLTRTTRSLHLSEAGQRYAEDCRRILGELDEAEAAAAGSYSLPSGVLTITAPVLFGDLYVTPLMAGYLDRYPPVSINALLVDRVVDMLEEGVDVAIRIGHLQEAGHHAVTVGHVRQVVCATPGYWDVHGRPSHPGELRRATIIQTSASHLHTDWHFVENGQPLSWRPEPRLVVTANQAAIHAASLGWGVTRVLSYQVARRVAAGELEVVLAEFEPPALPIQVVYAKGARLAAKVSTFVAHCVEQLGQDPALNPLISSVGADLSANGSPR
ncbi:MAG: LysR family transcriptional regulator [Pseudomonas sp.]|uniref:LysR family transcriptional regulator n=1 Tax=Pseudomonas abieticivorans TaxID=2931382 RepID=UPI0020C170AC|nr:LysR family transcriptional regulator [Pseudomonas sp. PIA16]MDE1164603.1 LysR family transcriptional regulator [Pseudomonas sp.]